MVRAGAGHACARRRRENPSRRTASCRRGRGAARARVAAREEHAAAGLRRVAERGPRSPTGVPTDEWGYGRRNVETLGVATRRRPEHAWTYAWCWAVVQEPGVRTEVRSAGLDRLGSCKCASTVGESLIGALCRRGVTRPKGGGARRALLQTTLRKERPAPPRHAALLTRYCYSQGRGQAMRCEVRDD